MALDVVGQAAFDELGIVWFELVVGALDAGPDELFVGDLHLGVAGLQIVDEPAGIDHDRGDGDGGQGRATGEVIAQPSRLSQDLGDGVAGGSAAVDQHLLAIVDDDALAFQGFAPALGFDGENALGSDQQVVDVEGDFAGLDRDVVEHLVALGAELFEKLADGFFGGQTAVDEPYLFDGFLHFQNERTTRIAVMNVKSGA